MGIDFSRTLEELKARIAIAGMDNTDARSLVFMADAAVRDRVPAVSVAPEYVHMMWAWLEKSQIKIFARFEANNTDVAKLAEQINTAFKKGAIGAQIAVSAADFEEFVQKVSPVVPDLFFGRTLIFVFDLNSVNPFDWPNIFYLLKKVDAAGIGITTDHNANTAGAIYGMLDSVDADFSGLIQFISPGGEMIDIENMLRLAQKMRPEILPNLQFFISSR
jgi:hypothetical protein